MTIQFSELGLRPELVQATTELGYETPTPIQEGVIPLLLAGHDVIGQAQTGTGKTAAFALPILQNIDTDQRHIQALVMAPTRELAGQVAKAVKEFSKFMKVKTAVVYGGQPYSQQIRDIKRGAQVIVGTPGRLIDLMEKKHMDLSNVKMLALDEADEMLSMGFVEDIEKILAQTPDGRQTLLFSATMPRAIRNLANKYMNTPETVTIARKSLTVSAIEQRHYLVNHRDRLNALMRVIEAETVTRAIVFARTRADSSDLAVRLTQSGYPAEAINGDLTQDARERVLRRFRADQIKILVATDVAARGLDIDDVSHVFNYELGDPEAYVHRIGRTGRAGKEGIAVSFVTPKERGRLVRVERFAKIKIPRAELPTADQIQVRRDEQLQEKMMVWLNRGRCKREREMVDALVLEGHDPADIAAAALKLSRSQDKRKPVPEIGRIEQGRGRDRGDSRDNGRGRGRGRDRDQRGGRGGRRFEKRGRNDKVARRSHEDGMVRLQFRVGAKQGVRPGEVVGTIAHFADIPGSSLGAIRIQEQLTYVDVPSGLVGKVLAANGNYRLRNKSLTIEKSGS